MNLFDSAITIEEMDGRNVPSFDVQKKHKKVLKLKENDRRIDDILGVVGIASSIVSCLTSLSKIGEKKFVVDINPETLKGIQDGVLKFTRSSDGKMYAQTRKINETGKSVINSNLTIHPENSFDVGAFASSISSLCMQAQIQQIIADLEDIKDMCARIERGQHNDRVGLVIGGRDSIEQALSEENIDVNLLAQAISTLNNARGQLGKELEDGCKRFKKIPKNVVLQIIKSTISMKTYSHHDDEVERMAECYYLYTQATAMVAFAHKALGKNIAAENAIKEGEVFIKSVDFSNVKSIEHIHKKEDFSEAFFNKSLKSFSETRKTLRPYDCVRIEVTGKKLLDALNDKRGELI